MAEPDQTRYITVTVIPKRRGKQQKLFDFISVLITASGLSGVYEAGEMEYISTCSPFVAKPPPFITSVYNEIKFSTCDPFVAKPPPFITSVYNEDSTEPLGGHIQRERHREKMATMKRNKLKFKIKPNNKPKRYRNRKLHMPRDRIRR